MDWKKTVILTAAILGAAYVLARWAAPERGLVAMAGGGAGGLNDVVAFTSDAAGNDGNRLFVVLPSKQKILVYRLNGNFLGLIAARSYEYDQELIYTPGIAPGNGYEYPDIRKQVEEARKRAAAGAGVH